MWLVGMRLELSSLRLDGLSIVTVSNPQFIIKPQRRRNFI